jgi:hypothetical protein
MAMWATVISGKGRIEGKLWFSLCLRGGCLAQAQNEDVQQPWCMNFFL